MNIHIKKHRVKSQLFLLLIPLIILMVIALIQIPRIAPVKTNTISFSYYKDESRTLTLHEVKDAFFERDLIGTTSNLLAFGNSRASYWVRIPLKELATNLQSGYLLIYNPTVEKVVLYLPISSENKVTYRALSSGWIFGEEKQDGGFSSPVYHWDENTDFEEDAYLELYSPFTQNYTLDFMTDTEFEHTKQNSFLLYGVLFGILLAVAIQNIFMFLELKERANLYYFIYVLLMTIYQGCLLGVYNIYLPKYAKFLMANTIFISFAVMCASILFFQSFFQTKKQFPLYHGWGNGLLATIILGAILILLVRPASINLFAHAVSVLGSGFLLLMAIDAYRKGATQAKMFIAGWTVMMVGLGVSLFRNAGLVSNNLITTNVTFFAITIQSVLLSLALVQTMKVLMLEKEASLRRYYEAKALAEARELAFLHAQIKPHFLYNALNVMISLCRIDPEKARDLLLDLSGYLRRSFDFCPEQKLILLTEELECVYSYVRIEQARFPNKLNVCYETEGAEGLMIPPLMLQPLIENAIVHGIRKKNESGTIYLRIWEQDSSFYIEVQDDGVGMEEEQIKQALSEKWNQGNGVGLANINRRLLALYRQGLLIHSTLGEGTRISFQIPKGDTFHANSNPCG